MRRWYSSVGKSELYIAQRQLAEHPKIRSSISKVPDYPSIWPEYFRPVWFTSDAIKDLPVTSENAIYMKRAFSHWNASRSELNKVMTRQLVDLFKRDEGDSGSSEVQIAVFSLKIACVKEHLRRHPKDVSARLNLEKLEVKRRGMMEYLKRIGYERYLRCIRMLGLPDTAKGYKKVRRAKIFN